MIVFIFFKNSGMFWSASMYSSFGSTELTCSDQKFEGKPTTVDNKFYVSDIKDIKYSKRESYKSENRFVVKSISQPQPAVKKKSKKSLK